MNASQFQASTHLLTSSCPAVLHVNASARLTSSTKNAQESNQLMVIRRMPHEATLVDADHELTRSVARKSEVLQDHTLQSNHVSAYVETTNNTRREQHFQACHTVTHNFMTQAGYPAEGSPQARLGYKASHVDQPRSIAVPAKIS